MALKARAIPWPELAGKTLLDVGCDHGFWCWEAGYNNAKQVVGLDRGRMVNGGFVDLAERNRGFAETRFTTETKFEFWSIDIGKQWHEFGKFDVVLCMSMYHHVFQNCRDHEPIWFWLWRNCGGVLIWENPVNAEDAVVRINVAPHLHKDYTREKIMAAAERYFDVEYIGPALHMPHREVWRCHPKPLEALAYRAKVEKGHGGASAAFQFMGGRRIAEIGGTIGIIPIPGSLNLRTWEDFPWDRRYYRAEILDLEDRKNPDGLAGSWKPRWARFYPVRVNDHAAHAFRFEGDRYDARFVELIAPYVLREHLVDTSVHVIA